MSACGANTNINEELIIEEGENVIQTAVYGVDTYNPLCTKSQSVRELLNLIYEPLFEKDGELRPVACLAERVQTAPDGMSAEIFLSAGAKWQDGSPFCADDVVYTINRIKAANSSYKNNVAPIASAESVNSTTVTLSLYSPVMSIEGLLDFPIVKSGSADTLDTELNGTGAFSVAEKTAAELVLVPSRYRGQTSVSAVRVRILRNSEACVNAFETNDLDVITSAAADLGVKTPGGNIQIKNYTSNRMTLLGFNCSRERYKSPDIRLAICEIINRDELVEKAKYGRATASSLPFNPAARLCTEFDGPELDIKGTMANAGYTMVDGVYTDMNGDPLSVSVLASEESADKTAVAELIALQLRNAGIPASVESVAFDDYIRRVNALDYDMFVGEVTMPDNLDPGFLCENGNYFGFDDSVLCGAVNDMRLYCTEEARVVFGRAFISNPPYAPLYYANDGVVYRKNIAGITEPNFRNNLCGLENWYFRAEGRK